MGPEFVHSGMFQWVILPILIFLARLVDMSMDTIRIMLLSRGKKFIPPLIGFFQVSIWLLAIRQIFLNLSNVMCFIGYSGGFAMGTYVGMLLEERLAIGVQVIRVITRVDASELIRFLRKEGYGVTSVDGQGATGKVNIIYTIVNRSQIPKVLEIVLRFNPRAFYTIEDVRTANQMELYKEPVPGGESLTR